MQLCIFVGLFEGWGDAPVLAFLQLHPWVKQTTQRKACWVAGNPLTAPCSPPCLFSAPTHAATAAEPRSGPRLQFWVVIP